MVVAMVGVDWLWVVVNLGASLMGSPFCSSHTLERVFLQSFAPSRPQNPVISFEPYTFNFYLNSEA